jgi:deoxycytidylate deaminase
MALPKRSKPTAKATERQSEPAKLSSTVSLRDRDTDEIVIALVAPVGSGASSTAAILAHTLEQKFGYSTNIIKMSKLIEEISSRQGLGAPSKDTTPGDRIRLLQEAGNFLRQNYKLTYLAEKAVETIALDRLQGGVLGYEMLEDDVLLSLPRRRVHIIDSLKHKEEARLLHEVYTDNFWMFGIFAPESVRKARLINRGLTSTEATALMERDEEEEDLDHGQHVRETIHLSDFFVRNDGISTDPLERTVYRFLNILFNVGVNTPNRDEIAMYAAASQASTSACLSRQVGAAIYSRSGELIGVGANDVPKPLTGGLYCTEDGDSDHRCYRTMGKICHNDFQKSVLYQSIFRELKGILDKDVSYLDVERRLKKTGVKNLIEFSRAVHVEMEAIISVARGNKEGIVGGSLYSTTFPCHNCARHIVAAGIKRVVFIEPYPKSLALTLHVDAISIRAKDASKQVVFHQYEGVAPQNFIRLFKNGQKRKNNGSLIVRDPRQSRPIFPSPLDGFSSREQIIVKNIKEIEAARNVAIERRVSDEGSKGAKPSAQLSLVDAQSVKPDSAATTD